MIAGAELLPVLSPSNPASTNPANGVARALTGRDYISWSAISTFRSCPLNYWFRYVAGMPEESVSSALVFGTGIHAAIENFYRAELAGEAKPDVEQLIVNAGRRVWPFAGGRTVASTGRVRPGDGPCG
jgi:ATP-dependent helicase/DNAse subunit B